jgi:polar amino acid transport system substrate-binding protein
VGTSGKVPPHSYYKGVELVGFDIELSRRFALWLNADLEFKVYNYGSIIAAALSGDIDCIFADLNVTPERKEKIGFSSPIYLIENTFLVRDSDSNSYVKGQSVYDSDQNDGFQRHSFLDGLKSSFEKTFLRESRWKLILNGIKITVIISILSALLGTILGFGICGLRLSRKKILNEAALVYIRLIQGLPMVVFLMVLFYIVFGKTGISGLWVAIIGFGMNFGAYVSEMIRTGILAVDKGQMEAALALGYTKSQAFIKIVFPQAACHFLPVFQGEFISLVKMTSVVGYIAIQDLTMAGDIIRSRTYEAFFPLITTAAIYFVIAWLLTRVLVTIQNRVNPKKRRK